MSLNPTSFEMSLAFTGSGEKYLPIPQGSSFCLVDRGDVNSSITVKNENTGQVYTLFVGQVHIMNFERIIVQCDRADTMTIVFGQAGTVVNGPPTDLTALASISGGARTNTSNSLLDVADNTISTGGTAQLLIAGSGTRYRLNIVRVDTNAGVCRIGGSSVSATTGLPLKMDGAITLETEGAVYIYNNSGSDMVFAIVSEI